MSARKLRLRAGDLVEVKSRDEILETLDARGCLDGMPFMPEMLAFCGKQLRVGKVAHKACDTQCKSGNRSVPDCVHLEGVRCDGAGHDGCQAFCNLFWKTAWLRKPGATSTAAVRRAALLCDEAALAGTTRVDAPHVARYRCQATEILNATKPLAWWDLRQYWQDVASGNESIMRAARILVLSWFAEWRRYGYPYRLSRGAYVRAHRLLMGGESPYAPDSFPYPEKSPTGETGLQVGQLVRVKPHHEILATLNSGSRNRGLWFDIEMVPFCGQERRVSHRVNKIINEVTGEMMQMKAPCIILEGAVCTSRYSDRRLMCPRAITPYWREIWLERIESANDAPPQKPGGTASG